MTYSMRYLKAGYNDGFEDCLKPCKKKTIKFSNAAMVYLECLLAFTLFLLFHFVFPLTMAWYHEWHNATFNDRRRVLSLSQHIS